MGSLPAGAVLAKDSFSVTASGKIAPGPLFLMEKTAAGELESTAGWRYTLMMPNGSVFGVSGGKNAAGVAFCHECHVAVEEQDHMFFLPEEYRK